MQTQKSSNISPFALMDRSNLFSLSDNLLPSNGTSKNKVNSPILKKELNQATNISTSSPVTQTIVNSNDNVSKVDNTAVKNTLEQLRKKLQKENWDLKKKNDSQLSQIKRLTDQICSLENSLQSNDQKTQSHLQLSLLWIIELIEAFLFVCFPYNNEKQKAKRAKWKKKILKKLNLNKGSILAIEQLVTLQIYQKTEEVSSSEVNMISRRNFSDMDLKKESEFSQLLFLIIQKAKENQTKFFELYQRLQLENNTQNTMNSNVNFQNEYFNSSNSNNSKYIMNKSFGDGDSEEFAYKKIGNQFVAVPILHHQQENKKNKESEKYKETIKSQKKLIKKLTNNLQEFEEDNKENINTIKQLSSELESHKIEKDTLVNYILTYQQQQKQFEEIIHQSSLQISMLTQENEKLAQQLAELNANFNTLKVDQLTHQSKYIMKKKEEESQQNYFELIAKLQEEKEKQSDEYQKKLRAMEAQIDQLQNQIIETSKQSLRNSYDEIDDSDMLSDDNNFEYKLQNERKKKKKGLKMYQNGAHKSIQKGRKNNQFFESNGEEEEEESIISDEYDEEFQNGYSFTQKEDHKIDYNKQLDSIREEHQLELNEKLSHHKYEFELQLKNVIDEYEAAKKMESEENFLLISQLKNDKSNLQFQIEHLQSNEEKLQKEINHWKMQHRDLQLKVKQLKSFIEHETQKWNSFLQNYSTKFVS